MSQGLVDKNGEHYFSDSLTKEVGDLVEPLVERRMNSSNMSREQAERETNIAMVEETEEGIFFNTLMTTITNKFLPAIEQVTKAVTAVADLVSAAMPLAKASRCSVM